MADDAQRHKRRRTIEENIQAMLEGPHDSSSSASAMDSLSSNVQQAEAHSSSLSGRTSMAHSFESLAINSDHESLDYDSSDGSVLNESLQNDSDVSAGSQENILAHIVNEEREEPGLHELMQFWAVSKGISHSALRDILRILKPYHPDLPLDPRTLLSTGTVDGIQPVEGGGFYYHFGVADGIKRCWSEEQNVSTDVSLQFNIDGLPIFKSTRIQLWPILAMIKATGLKSKPFVCGLFLGRQKPPIKFLDQFALEMINLMDNGLEYNNHHCRVHIHSFVCDTPARCLIKQTKLYSGYQGCDKCSQNGLYDGRMTFPEIGHALRTNETFRQREHPQHHIGDSPLEDLNIDMCAKFPIDYMHCCLLGCMKKMLLLWMKGPLRTRLSCAQKELVSGVLLSLRDHISTDFVRRPRSLEDVEYWKATEFRTFLLYTGCIALKGILKTKHYTNFLKLCVAIRLLLVPTERNVNNADQLLDAFVEEFGQLYGPHTLVYNIHSLTHLAADVRQFGSLEEYSAFPYENFLHSIKMLIRGSKHILQQTIGRIAELQALQFVLPVAVNYPQLSKAHSNGPVPNEYLNCDQYQMVKTDKFTVSTTRDNCVQIGSQIAVVNNLLQVNGNVVVVYRVFGKVGNLFKHPTKSSNVGIYKVSGLKHKLYTTPIESLSKKCTLLPYKKSAISQTMNYIVCTILHTV